MQSDWSSNLWLLPLLGTFGGVGSVLLSFLSLFMLLLTKVIRYQRITNDDIVSLSKHVKMSTIIDEDDTPAGIVVGKWFIGYMNPGGEDDSRSMTILMSFATHERVFKKEEIDANPDKSIVKFKLYIRRGGFAWLNYKETTADIVEREARPHQVKVIDDIIKCYESKHSCVALLSGKSGCGKSMLSYLLIKEFAARKKVCKFTKDFNPTDPGDYLRIMVDKISPTRESPLVILLDEVDGILRELGRTIPQHKNVPIGVKNKTDWNKMLDEIDHGMIKNVIIIMTTNLPLHVIDDMDPSYTRGGRVDIKEEMSDWKKLD